MANAKYTILLIWIFLFACTTPRNEPLPTPAATAVSIPTLPASPSPTAELQVETGDVTGQTAVVTRIVDGDTIDVDLAGTTYRVRYIGMDTPERGDFFYHEATEANRQLVEGQTVTLVKDVSETDRYGRLLRYVYLPNGTFVNAELVRQGYAQILTYPPDVKYQELFAQLQREAREAGLGLWGGAADTSPGEPTQLMETAVFATPLATLPPSTPCDPAYPTVCIPPEPPDLNCGSICTVQQLHDRVLFTDIVTTSHPQGMHLVEQTVEEVQTDGRTMGCRQGTPARTAANPPGMESWGLCSRTQTLYRLGQKVEQTTM